MPYPEVEALLGPPGDYRTGPVSVVVPPVFRHPPGVGEDGSSIPYRHFEVYWDTDTKLVLVDVKLPDADGYQRVKPEVLAFGVVADAYMCDVRPTYGPLHSLFLRAKGLLWKW
jgi:hypothetical protein